MFGDMKLLVVEDEPRAAALLRKGLVESGFAVDLAGDGDEALQLACDGSYDLVVLDVLVPQRDGWSVLAELRRRGDRTPVVYLTARDGIEDRVRGLGLGADDYLVKPFAFAELVARIRAVLRRGSLRPTEVLEVGDLRLDPLRHKATRGGQPLELTPKEFALLTLLAQRQGEVVTRTIIAETVWDMNFEADTNVIDVHVRRLRAKLDDPHARRLLHTVRGCGYVLEDR